MSLSWGTKHLILLLLLLLCSCGKERRINEELNRIHAMIQENPTGAQTSLDSLYQAETEVFSSPQLQARHILLDTYCKYRNDLEGSNDSLISIAEEYLLQYGTDHDKMLCLFLHGSILNKSTNGENIYPYFLKAIEAGKNTNDHYILGQINTYLTYSCIEIRSTDKLQYADNALKHYELLGKPQYILDAKVNKGVALYYAQEYEKSQSLLKSLKNEAIKLNTKSILAKIDRYLASVAIHYEQYDSAFLYLSQIPQEAKRQYSSREFDLLALANAKLDNKKDALRCTEEAGKTITNDVRLKSHYKLASEVYHEIGDDTQAYNVLAKHLAIKDSIYNVRFAQSVSALERDMEKEKLKKSETARVLLRYLIGLSILLLFSISVGCFYYIKKKKEEIKQLKEINELKSNNETLLKEQIRLNNEHKQQTLSIIRRTKPVEDIQYAITHQKVVETEVWLELHGLFDEMLPSFKENLLKNGPLSEQEVRICLLQKLNFSVTEISSLLCLAPNSISMKNARMYQKVMNQKGNSKDWLNYIHSL